MLCTAAHDYTVRLQIFAIIALATGDESWGTASNPLHLAQNSEEPFARPGYLCTRWCS